MIATQDPLGATWENSSVSFRRKPGNGKEDQWIQESAPKVPLTKKVK